MIVALNATTWGHGAEPIGDAARARAGLDPADPTLALALQLARRADRLSPPSHPAQRRLRHHPRPARRGRADHERGDGGSHHHRMGQGRSRRARHPEDRRARARHAHRAEQELRAAGQALWRASDARLDPLRGGLRLRDDPARRHHRRLPDREPRADVDAAAAQAGEVLRPRHRGRDRAPRADPGRHGASLSAPPAGPGGGRLSLAGSWRRCSARRSACRCSRSRR